MDADLAIASLRPAFLAALRAGPVVLSSPTGSGKSTEVPRWCEGRVVVVEPRRVACRSLAARVSDLEGTPLGRTVGYVVRDEGARGDETRILFATPGIVLRSRSLLERADTIILDEFHERSLDVDLLLALLLVQPVQATAKPCRDVGDDRGGARRAPREREIPRSRGPCVPGRRPLPRSGRSAPGCVGPDRGSPAGARCGP